MPPQTSLTIGPFTLTRLIGRGGMGQVWRATIGEDAVEVAAKIIGIERSNVPAAVQGIEDEARATAKLNHPGIVTLLDMGEVSAEEAEPADFAAGAPFLVMELVRGGSLIDHGRVKSFSALGDLLLQLLDALAHAHARGIIHRDIKPENILVRGERSRWNGLPTFVLTDFGIAHAVSIGETVDGLTAKSTRGTPHYMAPEQIAGRWRDHGPWTDLYALGCLAYTMARGRPPFAPADRRPAAYEVFTAHITQQPPPLEARFPIPADFHVWLSRLLAKHRHDRYQRCADAAWDLLKLLEGETMVMLDHSEEDDPGPSRLLDVADTELSLPPLLDTFHDEPIPPVAADTGAAIGSARPMPASWRRVEPPSIPQLAGAGLGLYRLRAPPLVAREGARDLIWRTLANVRATSSLRVILVAGEGGVGKSYLAEWMTRRAHELGVAEVFHGVHSPSPGRAHGLAPMVGRFLGSRGLSRQETSERAKTLLRFLGVGADDRTRQAESLASLVVPPSQREAEAGATRHASPAERYATLAKFLEQVAQVRPAIVWLDDLQWAPDAVAFLDHLVRTSATKFPCLVLATLRSDVTASTIAADTLANLAHHTVCERLELSALSDDQQRQLVEQLLPLAPRVVDDVVARTRGNPLFAVQLVGDWIDSDALTVGPDGFKLKRETSDSLPDDVYALWLSRLAHLYAALGDRGSGQMAVAIAATLGRDVDELEWRRACELAGAEVPRALTRALFDFALAEPGDLGWSFTNRELVAAIVRTSVEDGLSAPCHLACARALADLYPPDYPGAPARRAQHLTEAGLFAEAMEPMYLAAREARFACRFDDALRWLERRRAAQSSTASSPRDELKAALLAAQIHQDRGQSSEAERVLDEAEELLLPELGDLEAEMCCLRGRAVMMRGDTEGALALYQQGYAALTSAREEGDPEREGPERDKVRARLLASIADVHRYRRNLPEAERWMRQARTIYEQLGNRYNLGYTFYGLGMAYLDAHNIDKAQTMLQQSVEHFEASGSLSGAATALAGLSGVARARRDFREAVALASQGLDLAERLEHAHVPFIRLNLAVSLILEGDLELALPITETTCEELAAADIRVALAQADLVALAPCARARDWGSFGHHHDRGRRLMQQTGVWDREVGEIAEIAARECLAGRKPDKARARLALEVALSCFESLGEDQSASRVRQRLAAIAGRADET